MPKKLIHDLYDPSDIYPDPLGRAKGMAIYHSLADVAITDMGAATRLFANSAGDLERDIRLETTAERTRLKRERETEAEANGDKQA